MKLILAWTILGLVAVTLGGLIFWCFFTHPMAAVFTAAMVVAGIAIAWAADYVLARNTVRRP